MTSPRSYSGHMLQLGVESQTRGLGSPASHLDTVAYSAFESRVHSDTCLISGPSTGLRGIYSRAREGIEYSLIIVFHFELVSIFFQNFEFKDVSTVLILFDYLTGI